jgi:hypothetical protein
LLRRLGPLLPPVLFVAYPLLSLFEQNESELPLSVIWTPLVTAVVATAVLFGVLVLILKDAPKAGALTALSVVGFFYWETFKSDLSGLHLADGWLLALWLALFVVGAGVLVRTKRRLVNLMLGLGLAAAVLTVVPAVRIASYQQDHPSVSVTDSRLWPTSLEPPRPPAGARRPDIYVIIPDDYARADVLKRYFRYDNSAFIQKLHQRGFAVSAGARSPYSDSESNIAAELNMDYLGGLPKILGKTSEDVRPLKTLIEDNRASRLLKPLGYRYVHLDSDEVTFAGGNPDISSVATPDSFPSLWLKKSVLSLIGGPFGFDDGAANERFRKGIRAAFARLATVPRDPRPKFVVFHTLMPHDPYVFGARGQSVTFSTSDTAHGSRAGMRYYLGQVRFLETKLLAAVDAIRARSKQPPAIVIQSDEGFEANPENFGEAAMQRIRVDGLVALSLPGVNGTRTPQPPSTVNTLRYVFNRYFGTRYALLRNASYAEGDFPYQSVEIRGVAK